MGERRESFFERKLIDKSSKGENKAVNEINSTLGIKSTRKGKCGDRVVSSFC